MKGDSLTLSPAAQVDARIDDGLVAYELPKENTQIAGSSQAVPKQNL